MKKATKGALAAAAAGSLLLGGAGSLAYWTSTGLIEGDSITSGHLKLVPGTCDAAWQLHHKTDDVVAYSDQALVPGDSLTRQCTYTVKIAGDHLRANLAISAPGFGSDDLTTDANLVEDMTASGVFTYDSDGDSGSGAAAFLTNANDGSASVTNLANNSVIGATLTVAFKNAGTPDSSQPETAANLHAVLNDVTVTATQDLS